MYFAASNNDGTPINLRPVLYNLDYVDFLSTGFKPIAPGAP